MKATNLIKNQLKNLRGLSEELQLQMALGKAEARDLVERERKNLSSYIESLGNAAEGVIVDQDANKDNFRKIVTDTLISLNTEIPTEAPSYDSYKSNVLNRIYKLEEAQRGNYPNMDDETQEVLDTFKTKMDAFRVNLALHDKDNPAKVEQVRREFVSKLEEVNNLLEQEAYEETKADQFKQDISDSFKYLKKAIADLSE